LASCEWEELSDGQYLLQRSHCDSSVASARVDREWRSINQLTKSSIWIRLILRWSTFLWGDEWLLTATCEYIKIFAERWSQDGDNLKLVSLQRDGFLRNSSCNSWNFHYGSRSLINFSNTSPDRYCFQIQKIGRSCKITIMTSYKELNHVSQGRRRTCPFLKEVTTLALFLY
jgi:hypothetical protein